MTDTKLTVSGMTCRHCAQRVSRALTDLDGVREVDVDLLGGTVRVCHAPGLDPANLAEAISAAGRYRVSATS